MLDHADTRVIADIVGQIDDPESGYIGMGLLFINPTAPTLSLFNEGTNRYALLLKKYESMPEATDLGDLSEQILFNTLIQEHAFGIAVHVLDPTRFVCGMWYRNIRNDGAALRARVGQNAVIINFNWIAGNAAKILRARQYQHWCLRFDGRSCDIAAVRNLKRTLIYSGPAELAL